MRVLIDTSFLVAISNQKDKNHQAAQSLASKHPFIGFMPEMGIAELFFVIRERISYTKAISVLNTVYTGGIERVNLKHEDFIRIEEIMRQYESAKFDLVDTAIMALSERMNISTIFTFDRRDFSIFRPKHTDHLTLLP